MLDRAGSIYGTIGGLVVGLAGGAWLAAIQETSRWATSLFGLIVYAVLVVIGLYLSIASLAGWKLPGRQSRVQILIDEVDTFVEQIHDWLEIRRDDGHLHDHDVPWDARTRLSSQHSNATSSQWRTRFSVKALHFYDALVGSLNGKKEDVPPRSIFEHPTNVLGMEEAARTLGVLSLRLRSEKY